MALVRRLRHINVLVFSAEYLAKKSPGVGRTKSKLLPRFFNHHVITMAAEITFKTAEGANLDGDTRRPNNNYQLPTGNGNNRIINFRHIIFGNRSVAE